MARDVTLTASIDPAGQAMQAQVTGRRLPTAGLPEVSIDLQFGASATHGDGLRIGTFNTQLRPGPWGYYGSPCDFGGDDDTVRPAKIAERIITSQYDVIALNEVYDEDSQNAFVDKLKNVYPHYIKRLWLPDGALEDSGLMLFSRYPITDLPSATYRAGGCEGTACPEVAFRIFQDCPDQRLRFRQGGRLPAHPQPGKQPHVQRVLRAPAGQLSGRPE